MDLPSPEFDLRAYLLGTGEPDSGSWSVDRDLLDRAQGLRGTFSGTARFVPTHDGGLALREDGTVRWPSFAGPAFREYVLHPSGRPDALDVFFPDGRPFHRMSFSPDANLDRHWCDPDTYRVTYIFGSSRTFSYSWDVTGPRKDLLLTSRMTRLEDA